MTNSSVFERFRVLSLQCRDAQQSGNVTKANRIFESLVALKSEIYTLPDKGGTGFELLLADKESEVRLNAAVALIPLNEPLALRVIRALTKDKDGELAFTAQITLDQLAKGEAEFLRSIT